MIDFLTSLRSRPGDSQFKKERWITVEEALVLYELMKDPTLEIADYFECGTANGYSTCWATAALQTKTCCPAAHTWDIHDRPKIWDLPELAGAKRSIQFHHEKYNDSLAYWVHIERPRMPKEWLEEHNIRDWPALFFIDGDHRMRAARNDIRNSMKAALPGDILLLHDIKGYEWLNARFKEFQKTHRTEFFDTDRGMGAVWL